MNVIVFRILSCKDNKKRDFSHELLDGSFEESINSPLRSIPGRIISEWERPYFLFWERGLKSSGCLALESRYEEWIVGTGNMIFVTSEIRLFGEIRGDVCKVTKGVEFKMDVSIKGTGNSGELKECGRLSNFCTGTFSETWPDLSKCHCSVTCSSVLYILHA